MLLAVASPPLLPIYEVREESGCRGCFALFIMGVFLKESQGEMVAGKPGFGDRKQHTCSVDAVQYL